jgi:putative CocE/NonD family hydrolase
VQRFGDKVVARLQRLPPATHEYKIVRDLRILMRDGVELLADLYEPAGAAPGTILVRSPYGRSLPLAIASGGVYAARGHRVLLARCRGTFGSGGTFEPMAREVDDGADTVVWMRQQSWFDGRLATHGASYLGFTQWALLMDPPPELATAIISMGPHDFRAAAYANGAFNLGDVLGWSYIMRDPTAGGFLRSTLQQAIDPRVARAVHGLPLVDASDRLLDGGAPWYRDWVSRRDPADPWWSPAMLGDALDRVEVPVLLQSGWQDLFLEQTMEQYERLSVRGVDVALTIGPWTHVQLVTKGGPIVVREALEWLDEHLSRTGVRTRAAAVKVFVTGADQWRDVAVWPPASSGRMLYPRSGGHLDADPSPEERRSEFSYDPADPTPTVGGRTLAPATSGYQDDTALVDRPDVLSFTSEPLTAPVEIQGRPVVELAHSSDNPHVDLFVRLSEVDAGGRSRNVSDGFARLDPTASNGVVHLALDAVAHRFGAGHRIRMLVAGGSHPHWERNLGTAEDPATSAATARSHRSIDLARSRLILPVV